MLHIKEISKTFERAGEARPVLRDLNVTVPPGQFITIVGSNGAGKSTLLNLISGVFSADKGKIIIDGRDVTFWPEHKRAWFIGRVFQDPLAGTAPGMTIEENLALALNKNRHLSMRRGLSGSVRKGLKEELEKLGMGLEKRLTDEVELLSGGQRQALTLLMATMVKPKILLLDEHTAALDPRTAIEINHLTARLVSRSNITTLMVTHNLEDALRMGDRLIMMDSGKIVLDICGREKQQLTVEKLLGLFRRQQGRNFSYDRSLFAV